MAISICIPTYNRLHSIKRLLASISEGFADYPHEIIVADGGSTDGTIEYLKSLGNVTLIEQGGLTGSIKAFNTCFKAAKYDYIMWLSDDFVAIPEIIIKACRLMDSYSEIGIVAPKMIEPTYGNLPGVEFTPNFLVLSKTHIFRASVLREINYFDENYRTYCIDDDSCLSVLKLGYAMIFTKEVGLIHYRMEDETKKMNTNIQESVRGHEAEYFHHKWANLFACIEKYVSTNLIVKYKTEFFRHVSNRIFSQLTKPMSYAKDTTPRWYDHLLEQCIVFRAKEYKHLKDFYLAQRLPKEILSLMNVRAN